MLKKVYRKTNYKLFFVSSEKKNSINVSKEENIYYKATRYVISNTCNLSMFYLVSTDEVTRKLHDYQKDGTTGVTTNIMKILKA